jgi:hypothetical protein
MRSTYLRVVALVLYLTLFSPQFSAAQLAPSGRDDPRHDLQASFENPPAAARPMVRWWWPGGDVSDEEIARELRIIKDAGFGGVEIQSSKDGLNPVPTAEVARRVDSFLAP